MTIGERLEATRTGLKLTLEAVSQRTELGISTLSDIENSKREPSISQLSALAKAYSRTLSYFFEDAPVVDPLVLWRKRPEDDAVALAHEAAFRKLCAQYRQLEVWCGDVIAPSLPTCTAKAATFCREDAETLAHQVRTNLNLGEYPASSLLNTLENSCGIKIFHAAFEPTGTASCLCSEEWGMAILLNVGNISYRRNFDLAHELFHLLTWKVFRSADGSGVSSEREEELARHFAGSLLLPMEIVRSAIARRLDEKGQLATAALPALAEQFGVSIDALVWRIHDIYHFADERREETDAIIRAAKGAEDPRVALEAKREAPPKYPKRYMALAIRAFLTGEISTGKFCQYTDWSRNEAMKLMATGEDARREVQITSC
jgi:Zn-dependent peptidase ImmA (M78 family)/transcriptional regulator with XRE-family HTH domain